MTIAGLIARSHSISGFTPGTFYADTTGLAPGGAVFSSFVTIRVETITSPVQRAWIAGNHNGSNGWYFARAPSISGVAFVYVVDDQEYTLEVDSTTALDSTYYLGITSDGTDIIFLLDGVEVYRTAFISVASDSDFRIGDNNDPGNFLPCIDAIVNVGYDNTALSNAAWLFNFSYLRRYNVSAAPPALFYVSRDLNPHQGLKTTSAVWINTGTSAPTGNLSLSVAPLDMSFQEDPSPVYPGRIRAGEAQITEQLDLYIAPETGDDNNTGLSPAVPLRSMRAAYDKVLSRATVLAAPVVLHFAQGQTTWVPEPAFTLVTMDAQIIIWCDGAGQGSETGDQIVDSLIVTASATNLITVAGPLAPDAYQGLTILFTSGALQDYRRDIRNNSTTTLTPVATWPVAPNIGDAFDIVQPATTFLLDTGIPYNYYEETPFGVGPGGDTNVTVINAFFNSNGDFAETLAVNQNITKLFGVKFKSLADISVRASSVWGSTGPFSPLTTLFRLDKLFDVIGDFRGLWDGWGVSAVAGPLVYYDSLTDVTGYAVSTSYLAVDTWYVTYPVYPASNFKWLGGFASKLQVLGGVVQIQESLNFSSIPVRLFTAVPDSISYLVEVDNAKLIVDSAVAEFDGSNQLVTGGVFRCVNSTVFVGASFNNVSLAIDGGAGRGVLLVNSTLEYLARNAVTIEGDNAAVVLRSGSKFLLTASITGSAVGSPIFSSSGNQALLAVDASTFITTNSNPAGSAINPTFSGGTFGVLLQDRSRFVKSHVSMCTISGGSGLVCEGGSSAHFDQLTCTGLAGPAIRASLGSSVDVSGSATLTAATEGVDVTGGGDCSFGQISAVTVTAPVELRVSPTETQTVALGLPTAGSSYSNAGGGSSINRNL